MFNEVTILAVDDDGMNLEMLEVMLSDQEYIFLKALNGEQAILILTAEEHIDVVLLDLEMPVMDGYEALKRIKQSLSWREIPVIMVTSGVAEVTKTLALGANDFIAKPYNPEELWLRVMNHVRSKKKLADFAKDMNNILEAEVVKKTVALQNALNLSRKAEYEISIRLGRTAEFRDRETGMHTLRISELSKRLAQLVGINQEECEILRVASPLHDVGKIGIPDKILLKQGKLDPAEFDIMKMHTVIGGKILSDAEHFPVIDTGSIIALQHHERWDGTGYPRGLSEDDIHAYARIVSIVDVFDELCSERPYKKAFPLDKAMEIIREGRGVFFDPTLLDLFVENIDDFVRIREGLKDAGEEEPLTIGIMEKYA